MSNPVINYLSKIDVDVSCFESSLSKNLSRVFVRTPPKRSYEKCPSCGQDSVTTETFERIFPTPATVTRRRCFRTIKCGYADDNSVKIEPKAYVARPCKCGAVTPVLDNGRSAVWCAVCAVAYEKKRTDVAVAAMTVAETPAVKPRKKREVALMPRLKGTRPCSACRKPMENPFPRQERCSECAEARQREKARGTAANNRETLKQLKATKEWVVDVKAPMATCALDSCPNTFPEKAGQRFCSRACKTALNNAVYRENAKAALAGTGASGVDRTVTMLQGLLEQLDEEEVELGVGLLELEAKLAQVKADRDVLRRTMEIIAKLPPTGNSVPVRNETAGGSLA